MLVGNPIELMPKAIYSVAPEQIIIYNQRFKCETNLVKMSVLLIESKANIDQMRDMLESLKAISNWR